MEYIKNSPVVFFTFCFAECLTKQMIWNKVARSRQSAAANFHAQSVELKQFGEYVLEHADLNYQKHFQHLLKISSKLDQTSRVDSSQIDLSCIKDTHCKLLHFLQKNCMNAEFGMTLLQFSK